MLNHNENKTHGKSNDIRHWHLARHVLLGGLIFSRARSKSDSIIPLLAKKDSIEYCSRTDSVDSTHIHAPFQSLVNYLSSDNDKNINVQEMKTIVRRTVSNTDTCIEQNKLNDTIAQYEAIIHRLKNFDKFIATYSKQQAINRQQIMKKNENLHQNKSINPSIQCSKTQSLQRHIGRSFAEYLMNDCLLPLSPKSSPNIKPRLITVDTASQTDSILAKEPNENLNKLDAILDTPDKEILLDSNSKINAILVNSVLKQEENNVRLKNNFLSFFKITLDYVFQTQTKEKPLIQRLFEGKKSGYTSDDIHMESHRIRLFINSDYSILSFLH